MHTKIIKAALTTLSLLLILIEPLAVTAQPKKRIVNVGNLSCASIGKALSKADIIARASQLGIPNSRNQVENSFEEFAIKSINAQANPIISGTNIRRFRYFSSLRSQESNEQYVEPDGVDSLLYRVTVNGVRIQREYPESIFYDAKLVGGKRPRIRLKDGNYQILGFLDALRFQPAGANPRLALRMVFLTVSSTYIAQDVINEANKLGIAIFQYVVCENPRGTIGINDLVMGKGIPLNIEVYKRKAAPRDVPLPQGEPGSLAVAQAQEPDPPPPPPGSGL